MRIIDKNHDYYDYLQDPTDTITFDRRNSFLLTKEYFCERLNTGCWFYRKYNDYRIILLQCGITYWLILADITEFDDFKNPTKYKLELLTTWKNFDKPRNLLKLSLISFNLYGFKKENIKNRIQDMINFVNTNDYKEERIISTKITTTSYKTSWIEKKSDIPLLNACGISEIIEPLNLFCAIEEHFSLEKSSKETTEAKGATNDDKITMHGFDTKTSFRGKQ